MNLPNKLTVTRLVLVLVFAVFAFPYPESLGFMNEGKFFCGYKGIISHWRFMLLLL